MPEPLLEVEHLTTVFETDRGNLRAVDDVSFSIEAGSTLAVVGESGCGKSVTALSLMRLVASPPGRVVSGSVMFEGTNLLGLDERRMRQLRGNRISMVFQEPMTSLNPVFTVGSQVAEAVRIHTGATREAARKRSLEMLQLVGMPSPAERIDAYPHQLSGGMRQRVMIAMALSCKPSLLIADEPTTALDVTIQAQILELLKDLQRTLGMSVLFITHDLGVVAEFARDMIVMYAGRIVETGPVAELLADPRHPYTRGLLASLPPVSDRTRDGAARRLRTIEGVVPDLVEMAPGCRFANRCTLFQQRPSGHERCVTQEPDLVPVTAVRRSRCYYAKT
ncbi:MAG: ABC transporter ATP-binding protein [Polyangiaceae bacterium]|nr:ABC transporter ATP-binding protein [Polyangiaceae bacterium]